MENKHRSETLDKYLGQEVEVIFRDTIADCSERPKGILDYTGDKRYPYHHYEIIYTTLHRGCCSEAFRKSCVKSIVVKGATINV